MVGHGEHSTYRHPEAASGKRPVLESSGAESTVCDSTGLLLNQTAATLRRLLGDGIERLWIERVIVGVFFTGVKLNNGNGGVAYTPPELIRRGGVQLLDGTVRPIKGSNVANVIAGITGGTFAEVIRLATLNALSVPFFDNGRYQVEDGDDLSVHANIFTGRKVCLVGAIIPLLQRLRGLGTAETVIIDQKTETGCDPALGRRVSPADAAASLGACDTAIFTGATIANGSLPQLISLVPESAAIAVVGPTAGFVPDELFRRRVSLVGTVVVTDSDQALDFLAEGGGAHQLYRSCMRKITISSTPHRQICV